MRQALIRKERSSYFITCVECGYLVISFTDARLQAISKSIITYDNLEVAKDAGWYPTSHPMFCSSPKKHVWLCPDCSKKYNWEIIS